MLTPRSTIFNTRDHIITFLPWQAVSSSSVVSSSVTWKQAGRQAGSGVAVIRPVASTTAKPS